MRFYPFVMTVVLAATCAGVAVAQTVEDASGNERVGLLGLGVPPAVIDDGSSPTGTPYFRFGGSPVMSAEASQDWGINGSYTLSLWFEGYDIATLNTNAVLGGSYADGSVPGFGVFFLGAKGVVNQIGAYHVSQTNPFTFNVVQDWQDLSVGWHHVGLVFEEGVGSSLYIDGVLSDADSTVTAGVAEYQRRFSIGGQDYSTARPFAGGIDDAILYPRAPSPTEISAIYAGNAPSGAALHWEFDSIDLPPADVPDLSGNNRDGYFTVEGPTAVNDGTGPHEGYLMLDGTGFVNSGWKPSELTGSYTVAAWFQGHDAAATNETVFGSYSDGANPGFVLQFVGDPRHGDDQLVAYHVTTTSPFTYATVKSPESYHDGWHHAVLVFEEGIGLRLYVDGAKVAEDASVTEGVSQFPVAFSAGGQNYTAQRPFTAGLDEVLVFDTAFSDAQVLDLYNNNTATGALLHWAFDADAQNLPGDLNGDGTVGSADLDIVRANWGATVEPGCLSCGDPSGDGSVGSADLDIIRANWGATAAAAVPEPSGLALLALSGMVLAGLGSRRGRK